MPAVLLVLAGGCSSAIATGSMPLTLQATCNPQVLACDQLWLRIGGPSIPDGYQLEFVGGATAAAWRVGPSGGVAMTDVDEDDSPVVRVVRPTDCDVLIEFPVRGGEAWVVDLDDRPGSRQVPPGVELVLGPGLPDAPPSGC